MHAWVVDSDKRFVSGAGKDASTEEFLREGRGVRPWDWMKGWQG